MRLEHGDAGDTLSTIRFLEDGLESDAGSLSSIDLDEADLITLFVIHEVETEETAPARIGHFLRDVSGELLCSRELRFGEDGVWDAPVIADRTPWIIGEREGAGDLIINVADERGCRSDRGVHCDIHGKRWAFYKTRRASEAGGEFLFELGELCIAGDQDSSVSAVAVRPLEDEGYEFFSWRNVFDFLYLVRRKV